MLMQEYSAKTSGYISFYLTLKDTVNNEKTVSGDSVISEPFVIEDSVRAKPGKKDSIPEKTVIQPGDSLITDSVKAEAKLKVAEKTERYLPDESAIIQDHSKKKHAEVLRWNASENFLTLNAGVDSISAENPTITSSARHTGNLRRILLARDSLNIEPKKRYELSNDWLLGIFLFITLLFLWVKIFYKKYFTLLLNSLLSYQLSIKLLREKNIMIKRVSFVLNFIYVIVLSTFILKILELYQLKIFNFNKFETLLMLINIIIIISVARILMLRLVGYIFNSTQIFNEYIHINYIINKNLGLFLFPLLIAQVYIAEKLKVIFIIAGITLILISYIIRFYRGFQIIIKKDIFLFYLILYLCTLEILPLLLGYKFFILLV